MKVIKTERNTTATIKTTAITKITVTTRTTVEWDKEETSIAPDTATTEEMEDQTDQTLAIISTIFATEEISETTISEEMK